MFTKTFDTGALVLRRTVICLPWVLFVNAGRDSDDDEVAGSEAFGGMVAAVVTPQGSDMARQSFVRVTYMAAAPV
jgi:hypothetical protein